MNEFRRQTETTMRQVVVALEAKKGKTERVESVAWPSARVGSVTLHNTDALLLLPTLTDSSIHCLITDPPWEVEFDRTFTQGAKTGSALSLTAQVLRAALPKLQDGALCWMFCASKHLMKGTIYALVRDCGYAIYEQFLLWYKPTVATVSHPYRELKNDYEPALLFSKGVGRNFKQPMFAVHSEVIKGRRLHRAQKPLGLLADIVSNSTVAGETVLDPFCGSGQVGRAAERLGRKAVLCDEDNRWYSTAVSEVKEETAGNKRTKKG